jgi:hypothetical protein
MESSCDRPDMERLGHVSTAAKVWATLVVSASMAFSVMVLALVGLALVWALQELWRAVTG